jgi:hypothetical protein
VSEASRCRYCDKAIVQREGRWRAAESSWANDAHCHYSAASGASVGHEPLPVPMVEAQSLGAFSIMGDVDCGTCGEALMRDGELLDVAFLVPPGGERAGIMCESCGRAAGVWED